MGRVTAEAHPNIALVKYWGKRDVALNLPAVPSVSMTLGGWRTRTTVAWGTAADEVVINGVARPDPKVAAFLDLLAPGRPPVRVDSDNDFPTGAGLASSASGFAALALAASRAAGQDPSPAELSRLARRGSGSACRSLFGGYVAWPLGTDPLGADCHAHPIAPADHWDLRMVVAVVAEGKKSVGSTAGMERSRLTSPFWEPWVARGPADVEVATQAIERRDLEALGTVMEQSTFRMHATMHTSTPPLLYWKPATVALLHEVAALRARGVGAWATMDAGPQVKVLCAPADADEVEAVMAPHALRTHIHAPGGPAQVLS